MNTVSKKASVGNTCFLRFRQLQLPVPAYQIDKKEQIGEDNGRFLPVSAFRDRE